MQGAILKSFTYENSGGNGAGVILLDKQVKDNEKQAIATRIGLSETAFVFKKDNKNFELSFFTPVCEVELCGHATIAAFYYLGFMNIIKGLDEVVNVYQHTKAGKLGIEMKFNSNVEYVLMQQQTPQISDEFMGQDLKCIADSLNTSENSIGIDGIEIYPTIVSTGLRDIMVPVKSRQILNSLEVDLNGIAQISNEKNVVGYHVYTIENNKIYARNFAPKVGINEECATGTSNGALCGFLYKRGIISNETEVIQGESMNEKSLIYVEVADNNSMTEVYVGGKASFIKKLNIQE